MHDLATFCSSLPAEATIHTLISPSAEGAMIDLGTHQTAVNTYRSCQCGSNSGDDPCHHVPQMRINLAVSAI